MPDIFAIIAVIRDHGVLFASTTLLALAIAWLLYRDLRRYIEEHRTRLEKIDLMEDAIKGHKYSTTNRVYTREELVDLVDRLNVKFDVILSQLDTRCYMENCPHHKDIIAAVTKLSEDSHICRDDIRGAVKDVKEVTHELLDFTGCLVRHFTGRGQG